MTGRKPYYWQIVILTQIKNYLNLKIVKWNMVSFDDIDEKQLDKLSKYGFEKTKTKTAYEKVRLQGLCTVVLYKTGRLLLQGKKDCVESTKKIISYLGIEKEKKKFSGLAIGTDETLKGDTFGGIVVAGFLADDLIRDDLKIKGVKDSKKLTNSEVCALAQILIKEYPERYHVEALNPKQYNKFNVKYNVTDILNQLHGKCFKALSRQKAVHIVDEFPGCSVGDIIEKKADSRYLEVGAASIIARYAGLKQIRELEKKAGLFIPLGSTNVTSALIELKKKSLKPEEYVKLKFKNVIELFG